MTSSDVDNSSLDIYSLIMQILCTVLGPMCPIHTDISTNAIKSFLIIFPSLLLYVLQQQQKVLNSQEEKDTKTQDLCNSCVIC